MLRRFTISLLTLALLCTTLLAGCKSSVSPYKRVDSFALGTFAQVTCRTELPKEELTRLIAEIDAEAKASMSIFDESSIISQINANKRDSLDHHIDFNLSLAKEFYALSNGYYDITVKPLTAAWGFAMKSEELIEPNIDSLLQFVGLERITIANRRLTKEDERIQFDLNSIAKGYVVDLVAQRLEELGIDNYMVNIGGEIRCKGINPRGGDWTIGIETPYDGNFAQQDIEKIVSLTDCAVATSGNYRRFHIAEDGSKITHTINPKTGYTVNSDLLSATVIAPTCAEADAAATMFMAMGSEAGALELARRCEEERSWGYYFIYADGESYRIEASASLK
ncbi:MAG: FAD:protein FMN transferase [Alistipes sp.]|nr:FAD:protein FMN transferase [Alistipes sp.]